MNGIPAAMARLVRDRAADRCEYCGLAQIGQEATFHIDHIIPQAARGPSDLKNLALACVSCSLRKAARTRFRDPRTKSMVAVFDPRSQRLWDHFKCDAGKILGRTACGRATVAALRLNQSRLVTIRQLESKLGRFPPPTTWSAGTRFG